MKCIFFVIILLNTYFSQPSVGKCVYYCSPDRVLILLISSLADRIIPAVSSAALHALIVSIAECQRNREHEEESDIASAGH